MNFDYEKFAKEFIKQMPGSMTAITVQDFADEYIAFVKRNRADKTYNGVKLVCKKLLSYFSPIRKLEEPEKDLPRIRQSESLNPAYR